MYTVHLTSIRRPYALLSFMARLRLPRGTRMTTYCCFLPDLTGFVGSCCAGPERQHQFTKADHTVAIPRQGIQPRYSGLQVQGAATSPLSTVSIIITFSLSICNGKHFIDKATKLGSLTFFSSAVL